MSSHGHTTRSPATQSFIRLLASQTHPADRHKIEQLEAKNQDAALIDLIRMARRLGLLPEALDAATQCVAWEASHRYQCALADYRPVPLPVPIQLFHATERDGTAATPGIARTDRGATLGWEQLLPPSSIRTIPVPGNHLTMMNDPAHRAILGAKLTEPLKANLPSPPHARDRYDPLIPLHTSRSTEPPVVLIPGAGASIGGFAELAGILGERWSVYGLQPRGVQAGEVPHVSVEAAARTYVTAIDKLRRAGTVHLLGHSFGGWIAFEVACRLQSEGCDVASLTLLDSRSPDAGDTRVKDIQASQLHNELLNVIRLSFECALEIDERVLSSGNADEFVQHLHSGMVRHGILPARSRPDLLHGPLEAFGAAHRAVYVPERAYSGRASLALVRNPRLPDDDDGLQRELTIAGWRRRISHLEVWHGPGHHFSILRAPHVKIICRLVEGDAPRAHGMRQILCRDEV